MAAADRGGAAGQTGITLGACRFDRIECGRGSVSSGGRGSPWILDPSTAQEGGPASTNVSGSSGTVGPDSTVLADQADVQPIEADSVDPSKLEATADSGPIELSSVHTDKQGQLLQTGSSAVSCSSEQSGARWALYGPIML